MCAAVLAAAVLCWLAGPVLGDIVETGEFKIMQPVARKMKAEIAFGNFGRPEYGGDLQGHLVVPYEDALSKSGDCSSRGCRYGCESLVAQNYTAQKIMGLPAIMMLERGPPDHFCDFFNKAINAQDAGATALMIANYDDELFTMDVPPQDESWRSNLTIPVALIGRSDADKLLYAYQQDSLLIGAMNWTNSIPKDAQVHWEYWGTSDDACGVKCETEKEFLKDFTPIAQILEQHGWTHFTPHYLMWTCPMQYRNTTLCDNLCIEGGEYCAPDPEDDEESGYDGKDVVMENRRQLCIFRQANETGEPWFWWNFVNKFNEDCSMTRTTYDAECSERTFISVGGQSLGGGLSELRTCMESDTSIGYLQNEVEVQYEENVVILPSIIINGAQYRGALHPTSVLKALCSAFYEDYDSHPNICTCTSVPDNQLLECISTNGNDVCKSGQAGAIACAANTNGATECMEDTSEPFYKCGCKDGFELVKDKDGNSFCTDINECKTKAQGIQDCTCPRCACHNEIGSFVCEPDIPNPCDSNNGGCWAQTIDGKEYSACVDRIAEYKQLAASGVDVSLTTFKMSKCMCPAGFVEKMKDGAVTCSKTCPKGSVYHEETGLCLQDADVTRKETESAKGSGFASMTLVIIIFVGLVVVSGAGFGFYRYRMRSYMDKEIRSIMSQYMPLEEENQA